MHANQQAYRLGRSGGNDDSVASTTPASGVVMKLNGKECLLEAKVESRWNRIDRHNRSNRTCITLHYQQSRQMHCAECAISADISVYAFLR